MTIALTSITPTTVPTNGGYLVTMIGTFPLGERLNVHIGPNGTTADPVAYSGKPGQVNDVFAATATKIRFYTPLLNLGGPFEVLVLSLDSVDQAVLTLALSTLSPDFKTRTFALRGLLPLFYKVGPRNMQLVEPLL